MQTLQSAPQVGQSCSADTRQAVADFHARVAQADMGLVMFFASSEHDRTILTEEMNRLFTGVRVIGCTTAGEIGPIGLRDRSLCGVSFPAATFTAVSGRLERLHHFEKSQGAALVQRLSQELSAASPGAAAPNSFALLLIDGLSESEDVVTSVLQRALGKTALVGGSAGWTPGYDGTFVFHDGAFHADAAVLTLVTTALPFQLFKAQDFAHTAERLVITAADPAKRIVTEINGMPAAAEYARLVGADVRELDSYRFAHSPVVVVIDGADYGRAIRSANPDGSLSFACAIEAGVVLRLARGVDLLENLKTTLESLRTAIGPLQLVLAFDCKLRKFEINRLGLREEVAELFRSNHGVGFHTYGEQLNGVHINQTLTGVAIGAARAVCAA